MRSSPLLEAALAAEQRAWLVDLGGMALGGLLFGCFLLLVHTPIARHDPRAAWCCGSGR